MFELSYLDARKCILFAKFVAESIWYLISALKFAVKEANKIILN